MTIYYLYVKTHRKTGLKYLGKTIQNPFKYTGSGIRWRQHIRKHGNDIATEILQECKTNAEIKYWGLYYSNLWDIVNDRDKNGNKIWANLKPESGDGFPSGDTHPQKLNHNRKKSSLKMKAQYETVWKNDPENKKMRSIWGRKGAAFMQSTEGKLLAASRIATKNGNYNHIIFTFEHIDTNQQFTGTSYVFRNTFNLIQSSVSMVISGKRKTVKGWKII